MSRLSYSQQTFRPRPQPMAGIMSLPTATGKPDEDEYQRKLYELQAQEKAMTERLTELQGRAKTAKTTRDYLGLPDSAIAKDDTIATQDPAYQRHVLTADRNAKEVQDMLDATRRQLYEHVASRYPGAGRTATAGQANPMAGIAPVSDPSRQARTGEPPAEGQQPLNIPLPIQGRPLPGILNAQTPPPVMPQPATPPVLQPANAMRGLIPTPPPAYQRPLQTIDADAIRKEMDTLIASGMSPERARAVVGAREDQRRQGAQLGPVLPSTGPTTAQPGRAEPFSYRKENLALGKARLAHTEESDKAKLAQQVQLHREGAAEADQRATKNAKIEMAQEKVKKAREQVEYYNSQFQAAVEQRQSGLSDKGETLKPIQFGGLAKRQTFWEGEAKRAQTEADAAQAELDALLGGGPAPGQQNQGGGRSLDEATAQGILQEVGGDKNKARELARQRGYTFGQ